MVARKWFNEDGTRMGCVEIGCPDFAESVGMCKRHRARQLYGYKGASQSRYHADGIRRTCLFSGCTNDVDSRGLCNTHYSQARAGKELHPIRQRFECVVPGCERVIASQGVMCKNHNVLRNTYSLTMDQIITLHLPQNYACSNLACRSTVKLHMDHDHACCAPDGGRNRTRKSCGKCVRGWLCASCNVTLGRMAESPERLRGLADYAERFS